MVTFQGDFGSIIHLQCRKGQSNESINQHEIHVPVSTDACINLLNKLTKKALSFISPGVKHSEGRE